MLYSRKLDERLAEEYRKESGPLNFSGEASEGQGQGLFWGHWLCTSAGTISWKPIKEPGAWMEVTLSRGELERGTGLPLLPLETNVMGDILSPRRYADASGTGTWNVQGR